MYFCFYEFLTCYCIIVVYNTLQEGKLKLRIAEAFSRNLIAIPASEKSTSALFKYP